MADTRSSAARNASIMAGARPEAGGVRPTIRGTAVPNMPQMDPRQVAFEAWIGKTYPQLSGLGGGARRAQMMPQLQAEFEPVWMAMQKAMAGKVQAPPATLSDIMAAGGVAGR